MLQTWMTKKVPLALANYGQKLSAESHYPITYRCGFLGGYILCTRYAFCAQNNANHGIKGYTTNDS